MKKTAAFTRMVSGLCAVSLCASLVPVQVASAKEAQAVQRASFSAQQAQSLSADASADVPFASADTSFKIGDTFEDFVAYNPADLTDTSTSYPCTFTVLSWDEDTLSGTVDVGASKTELDGAITIPDTVTTGGSTFTVIGVTKYGFRDAQNLTCITLPDTIIYLDTGAFYGPGCFAKGGTITLPVSVKSIGKWCFGSGQDDVAAGPETLILEGDASDIAFGVGAGQSGGSDQWYYQAYRDVNIICKGNADFPSTGNPISLGVSTDAYPTFYVWYEVSFYPSSTDAQAGTSSLGTAYVSCSTEQTTTKTLDERTAWDEVTSFVTNRDLASETLGDAQAPVNDYFYAPDGENISDGEGTSEGEALLTNYPAYPSGTNLWLITGNPAAEAALGGSVGMYAVASDACDLSQGYYTGVEASYPVTGFDITPDLQVYDCNGALVDVSNYDVVYERYDDQTGAWVSAPAGSRGNCYVTYRLVITGIGSYSGSLVTAAYNISGLKPGDTFTYPINNNTAEGTAQKIDCSFTVLSVPAAEDPGTITTTVSTNTGEPDVFAGTTGEIILPATIDLSGQAFILTDIGAYSFGKSSATASPKCDSLTSVVIPDTVTTIGNFAFAYLKSFSSVVIPASVTTIGNGAFTLGSGTASASNPRQVRQSVTFEGDASAITSVQTSSFGLSYYADAVNYFYVGADDGSDDLYRTTYADITKWYAVSYYASDAQDAELLGRIFVAQGTSPIDMLQAADEVETYGDAQVPDLPQGATSWTFAQGTDLYSALSGGVRVNAAAAQPTDLSYSYATGMRSSYWYTGENIDPAAAEDFGMCAADGTALDSATYSISYEKQLVPGDDSTWTPLDSKDPYALADAGSYRLVITPAAGSPCTGVLYVPYDIAQTSPGDIVHIPVVNTYTDAAGTEVTQDIDCTFSILTVADGTRANGTVAVARAQGNLSSHAVDMQVQGKIVFPEEFTLGNETYAVTEVGSYAFACMKGLKEVTLPASLTAVGSYAFYCVPLSHITLPEKVESVGSYAFGMSTAAMLISDRSLREVLFAGSGPSALVSASNAYSNSSSAAIIFAEDPTKEQTSAVNESTFYYRVSVFSDKASAETGQNPVSTVFVQGGATLDDAFSNSAFLYQDIDTFGDICTYFPEAATEAPSYTAFDRAIGWEYMDSSGGIAAGSAAVNRCYAAYPIYEDTPLSTPELSVIFEGSSAGTSGDPLTLAPGESAFGDIVYSGDGTLSVSVENSWVAAAELSDDGTRIEVAAHAEGRTTVTLSASETSAYTAATCTFDVIVVSSKKSLDDAAVSGIEESYTYTGSPIEPHPTVELDGVVLDAGTDYTVSYADNTEVGTATITITGIGGYTGEITVTFAIAKADVTYNTIAGEIRYDTMEQIVEAAYDGKSSSYAILATGENFPDALAAASLAGVLDAPIVLASKENTAQAVSVLQKLGVTKLYIAGGTSAVSDAVVASVVQGAGVTSIDRLAGGTRQETAILIAAEAAKLADNPPGIAIIATGSNFADALAISPYAYSAQVPIYLTQDNGMLDSVTLKAVKTAGYGGYIFVGGTDVVSDAVRDQLGVSGSQVERLDGKTRYDTAAKIAAFSAEAGVGLSFVRVSVATGENFPDALVGAAWCGQMGSVMVLAHETADAPINLLSDNKNRVLDVTFLGGKNVVTDVTRSLVKTALE